MHAVQLTFAAHFYLISRTLSERTGRGSRWGLFLVSQTCILSIYFLLLIVGGMKFCVKNTEVQEWCNGNTSLFLEYPGWGKNTSTHTLIALSQLCFDIYILNTQNLYIIEFTLFHQAYLFKTCRWSWTPVGPTITSLIHPTLLHFATIRSE